MSLHLFNDFAFVILLILTVCKTLALFIISSSFTTDHFCMYSVSHKKWSQLSFVYNFIKY